MQAIRGATQVEKDTPEAIAGAVAELCDELLDRNRLKNRQIISAIFTLTQDLTAGYPAATARHRGWDAVPMLCAQEIPVLGGLPRICRVLLHVRGRAKPRHVYLRGAAALRPDLAEAGSTPRKKKKGD